MCFIEGRWFRTMISGFKDKAGGLGPSYTAPFFAYTQV